MQAEASTTVNTPQAPIDPRRLLASQFLMRFCKHELESDFWRFQHASRILWVRVGLILAVIFTVATSAEVIPFASELLPEEVVELDRRVRLYLLCPTFIAGWIVTLFSQDQRLIQFVYAFAAALAGASFSSLILASGEQGIVYYGYSFLSALLFIYIIVVQPFRVTFFLTLWLCIFHIAVSSIVAYSVSPVEITFVVALILTAFAILSYGSYSMEFTARTAFVANRALSREYEERLALQEQRGRWLGLVTDFLRHEMRNSMIGISSSLQLVQRRNKDAELQDYVSRAGRCIEFMWRMLDEASRATSLESALSTMKLEEVDLSQLVREQIIGYTELYPDHHFEEDLEVGVTVYGDADKLIQLLDKLVNNAAEHANAQFPIRVSVSEVGGKAVLKVSDTGDTLTEYGDTVFQPFVSKKARGGGDNFGLGLYVVKRIAAAHHGEVAARGLEDPPGAEFSVSLPLITAASGSLYSVRS